jgi:hypothetical protein
MHRSFRSTGPISIPRPSSVFFPHGNLVRLADTIIHSAHMELSSEIETLKAADYRITDSEFRLADDEKGFTEPVSDGECSSNGKEEIPEADSDGERPEDGPDRL